MDKNFLFMFHVILSLVCSVRSEVFTALADLEELLETESHLIHTLENYIRAEEEKLNYLKRYAEIYRNHYNKAAGDVQLYVANPIIAYTLVKKLTADWRQVEDSINTDLSPDYVSNITYIKENMKVPTDEDLNGAVIALTQLQDTYRLDTSSLARGELNGVKSSAELSASDCFQLGREFYKNRDYYHTQLWMREADSRLKSEVNETVKRTDILEYLAFSTYKQGNISLALDLTNKLLGILPTNSEMLENKVYYEDKLQKSTSVQKKEDDGSASIEKDEISLTPDSSVHEFYKQLCRGEISLPVEKSSKLKCRYVNKNHPFLLIAPFKVEQMHHKPEIFIYHEVLADSEIATIRRLAHPILRTSKVLQDTETEDHEFAQSRISKSTWLKDHEHKHVADVSQRVSDMTGLTMDTAEELQVVNYGIGGYYGPHADFATDEKNAFKNLGNIGNRIATVLFYMNDVEQGGGTVFPNLHVALRPEKGAAAFWHNLQASGDGDEMTIHGACPVLSGSKWVSNKWIHERGQEFLRPCIFERPSEDLVA